VAGIGEQRHRVRQNAVDCLDGDEGEVECRPYSEGSAEALRKMMMAVAVAVIVVMLMLMLLLLRKVASHQ
jgi:hypothetical protein